jgi:hypothetical protein
MGFCSLTKKSRPFHHTSPQAKSNKTLLDKVFVGSVADKVAKSGHNVLLVH